MKLKDFIFIAIGALVVWFLVDQNQSANEALQERLEKREDSLIQRINESSQRQSKLIDSLIHYRTIKEKTIIIREETRKESSQKITEGQKATEAEADQYLKDRFPTKKANYIFTLKADSISLELRSLESIYAAQQKELLASTKLNQEKDLTISTYKEKDSLHVEIVGLKDQEIKRLNKEVIKYGIGGAVLGLLIGLVVSQ